MISRLTASLSYFPTAHTIGQVSVRMVMRFFSFFLYNFRPMKTQEDHNWFPCIGFGYLFLTGFPIKG